MNPYSVIQPLYHGSIDNSYAAGIYLQCRSGVFIVNFEHISHLVLEFL